MRGLVPDFPTEANIARAGGLGIRHSVGFRLHERKHPCLSARIRQTRRIPSCRLSVAAACRPQLRWKESGRAGFSGPPARGALPPPRTRRSLTQVPAAPEVGRCRAAGLIKNDHRRCPSISYPKARRTTLGKPEACSRSGAPQTSPYNVHNLSSPGSAVCQADLHFRVRHKSETVHAPAVRPWLGRFNCRFAYPTPKRGGSWAVNPVGGTGIRVLSKSYRQHWRCPGIDGAQQAVFREQDSRVPLHSP